MGSLKFIAQSLLDSWSDEGKVEIDGPLLRIPSEDVAFTLIPAVHFFALLEGEDSQKLVSKVKTEAYVREIGGEVMTTSCLFGDTAYEVQPGFLAESESPRS